MTFTLGFFFMSPPTTYPTTLQYFTACGEEWATMFVSALRTIEIRHTSTHDRAIHYLVWLFGVERCVVCESLRVADSATLEPYDFGNGAIWFLLPHAERCFVRSPIGFCFISHRPPQPACKPTPT